MKVLFHLAFPCHDLAAAKTFYHEQLGCELGRESSNALIINLGQNQMVAHRVDGAMPEPSSIYPRHFGLIFLEYAEFATFKQRIEAKRVAYHIEPKIRFSGAVVEHHSFFLKDPSNNLLEFKYYTNTTAIFDARDFKQIGEQSGSALSD